MYQESNLQIGKILFLFLSCYPSKEEITANETDPS